MKYARTLVGVLAVAAIFSACQTGVEEPYFGEVDGTVLEALANAGFNSSEVIKVEDGYIVEKDIFFTDADIAELTIGELVSGEHYRTTNIVTGTPRTITVRTTIGGNFPAGAMDSRAWTP